MLVAMIESPYMIPIGVVLINSMRINWRIPNRATLQQNQKDDKIIKGEYGKD